MMISLWISLWLPLVKYRSEEKWIGFTGQSICLKERWGILSFQVTNLVCCSKFLCWSKKQKYNVTVRNAISRKIGRPKVAVYLVSQKGYYVLWKDEKGEYQTLIWLSPCVTLGGVHLQVHMNRPEEDVSCHPSSIYIIFLILY